MRGLRLRRAADRPERALRDALERVERHAARTARPPAVVQLLCQVSGGKDWPRIHAYWARRGGLIGAWPRQLRPGELVLNLWPIVPGTVGLTTGFAAVPEKRQPPKLRETDNPWQLLSTPWMLGFDPAQPGISSEGALLTAIPRWIDDVVIEHNEYPNGVSLAPPILEEWATKGRLLRRTILTFDLDWQLPAAEGITWPPP